MHEVTHNIYTCTINTCIHMLLSPNNEFCIVFAVLNTLCKLCEYRVTLSHLQHVDVCTGRAVALINSDVGFSAEVARV